MEEGLEALDKCLGSFYSNVSLGELSNRRVLAHPRNKRDCLRWLCALSPSLQGRRFEVSAVASNR